MSRCSILAPMTMTVWVWSRGEGLKCIQKLVGYSYNRHTSVGIVGMSCSANSYCSLQDKIRDYFSPPSTLKDS